MKRLTEVTFELEEIVIVRGSSGASLAWCEGCANEVVMITPEQGSLINNVSVRTINQCVEAGIIHFIETGSGQLLVCLNSLRKELASRSTD
jgi:hypothetical protein